MPTSSVVPRAAGLVLEAINDLELALADLTNDGATAPVKGTNCIAWTAGHVTQMLESWLLHQFMHLARNPVLADSQLGAGSDGTWDHWEPLRHAIAASHIAARTFLQSLTEMDLARSVPYSGSLKLLQGNELNLEYALLRIAAHHFSHAAEIALIRSMRGVPSHENPKWGILFL